MKNFPRSKVHTREAMDSHHHQRQENDPEGSNTFFHTFRPQSTPEESGTTPRGSNDDRATKRRSIFTVSTALPNNASTSNSQNLINLVSEVSSLTSLDEEESQDPDNPSTGGRNTPDPSCDYKLQHRHDRHSSSPLDHSLSFLTPPTTPINYNDIINCSSGSLAKKHRHNSLENIHHPKNHRSGAKTSKSRPKRSKGSPRGGDEKKYVVQNEPQCYFQMKPSDKWVTADNRKTGLICRAAAAFAIGAVRKLKIDIARLEEDNIKRRNEAAARLILHSMLLNSWRNCRRQNEKLLKENGLHLRSVENMCLQLRVIRQMHREEKKKSQSRSLEVSAMSIQTAELQKERNKMQEELEKVENELNNCQVHMETLTSKNAELVKTKSELQKAIMVMEDEKQEGLKKTARIEMDNIRHQEMLQEMRRQLNEESKLRLRWQEEARERESKLIALRSDVEIRDKNLEQVQCSYQELKREVAQYKETAQRIQRDEQQLKSQLNAAVEEVDELTKKLQKYEDAMKEREGLVEQMNTLTQEKEAAIVQIRENLSLFLGDGVIRRRKWANAFHYLVFPLDIFRALFDMPRDHAGSYMVDLKEVNA